MLPTIKLLGVSFTVYDQAALLTIVQQRSLNRSKTTILSGNIHSFNLAYENKWLRDFFNQADIVRIDGAGVRLGAKLLGYTTPSRMTWADFAWSLAEFCAQNNRTLFFLGAKPGVAEKQRKHCKVGTLICVLPAFTMVILRKKRIAKKTRPSSTK